MAAPAMAGSWCEPPVPCASMRPARSSPTRSRPSPATTGCCSSTPRQGCAPRRCAVPPICVCKASKAVRATRRTCRRRPTATRRCLPSSPRIVLPIVRCISWLAPTSCSATMMDRSRPCSSSGDAIRIRYGSRMPAFAPPKSSIWNVVTTKLPSNTRRPSNSVTTRRTPTTRATSMAGRCTSRRATAKPCRNSSPCSTAPCQTTGNSIPATACSIVSKAGVPTWRGMRCASPACASRRSVVARPSTTI